MEHVSNGLKAQLALSRHGFHFTRSLGQNFLLEDEIIRQIVDLAEVEAGQRILEIGPGAGLMTAEMAERGAEVLAVELDQRLEPVLKEVLGEGSSRVRLVFQDILKADIAALTEDAFSGAPYRVVANLPYYITADALLKFLKSQTALQSMTLMVQKEAADRIMSAPGQKSYCALAATVQYFGSVRVLMDVPPEAFTPPPHVMSQLIRIDLYDDKPVKPRYESLFLRLIETSFAMRRKTLLNNIVSAFSVPRARGEEWLERAGLDLRVRGEALSLRELARLADAMVN